MHSNPAYSLALWNYLILMRYVASAQTKMKLLLHPDTNHNQKFCIPLLTGCSSSLTQVLPTFTSVLVIWENANVRIYRLNTFDVSTWVIYTRWSCFMTWKYQINDRSKASSMSIKWRVYIPHCSTLCSCQRCAALTWNISDGSGRNTSNHQLDINHIVSVATFQPKCIASNELLI